jgi:TPR repeat protein
VTATATGNTMNDGNKTQSAQNTPNFERAFFWYTRAYELGNWKAAAAIANMYRQGQHVEKSEEMALKFDQKSAQLQAQQQNQVQNDGIN